MAIGGLQFAELQFDSRDLLDSYVIWFADRDALAEISWNFSSRKNKFLGMQACKLRVIEEFEVNKSLRSACVPRKLVEEKFAVREENDAHDQLLTVLAVLVC